jgi:type I restriction enzyme, S subunit
MKYPVVEIGKLCLQTEQRDPRNVPDLPFAYVDISSVDKDLKAIVQTQEIIGKDAPSRARKVIRTEDVLVSTVRPNLNAVAIVLPELDGQIASTGFCVLRPKPALINSRYLFYRTLTQDFVSYLTARMRGANYPAVTDEVVRRATIPLPPLSEQRRIVEILDQANALRKKRADAKADRILPALFYKKFGDPAMNPKGWQKGQLSSVIDETQYGTSARANTEGKGTVIVRMNNIDSRGHIDLQDLKHIVLDLYEVEKYKLEPGDLLFNRTNSRELVGKTGLWRGEIEAVPASYLIRVRVNRKLVFPEYIWAYMNTAFIKQVLFEKARRAIGMANINAQELRVLPVVIPDFETQCAFTRLLSGLDCIVESRSRTKVKIDQLFQLLLHRAFSGDLTANWREAHMKELLAEMKEQAKYLAARGTYSQRENAALQESLF